MTTTGIQVDGTLSVTQLQLDSVDAHKIEGIATFKEVTTLYPIDPPPRQAFQFYIQAEMNLNHYVVQGGPGSTTHPDREQAAYGLNKIKINSQHGADDNGYAPTFQETRNLPVLDGAGVSTSAGTVETAHEANNTASGQFTVTITFLIDNNGDITPTVLVGAGPAQGSTNPDDPLSAEIGYWSYSGQEGGSNIAGDQLVQPAVPAPPSNTADDAGTAAPATLTASQVQTGFQDVLTGIENIYSVNTIESWNMTVDEIPISNVNKIANYARSVGHVGTIQDGSPIFAAGEKLAIQNSVAYSVDVTPIGGGENVTLIPLHSGASGIYGVLKQGAEGAATSANVPGYDFTTKTTDGGDTGGDTGGNTGGDTGGNTGGDTGGNTGPGSVTLPVSYAVKVNPAQIFGYYPANTRTFERFTVYGGENGWNNSYEGESSQLPAGLQELYRVFKSGVAIYNQDDQSISAPSERVNMIIVFAYVTSPGENVGKVIALWYPGYSFGLPSEHRANALNPPPQSAVVDLTNKLPAQYFSIEAVNVHGDTSITVGSGEQEAVYPTVPSQFDSVSEAASNSMLWSEYEPHIRNQTSS